MKLRNRIGIATLAIVAGYLSIHLYDRNDIKVWHEGEPVPYTRVHVNDAFLTASPEQQGSAAVSYTERHGIDTTHPAAVEHNGSVVGIVKDGKYISYLP